MGPGEASAEKAGNPAVLPLLRSSLSLTHLITTLRLIIKSNLTVTSQHGSSSSSQEAFFVFLICLFVFFYYLPSYPCHYMEPQPVVSFAFKNKEVQVQSLPLGVCAGTGGEEARAIEGWVLGVSTG